MAKRKGASAAFLKALRRKHGLGEFKGKSRKVSVRHSSSKMAKRKRSGSKGKGFAAGLTGPVMSGVTYAFVQPFVSQFLRRFNVGIQDELLQILAAILMKNMFKNQIVNNYANAAIIVNTASLASGLAGRFIKTNGSVAPVSAVPNGASRPFLFN